MICISPENFINCLALEQFDFIFNGGLCLQCCPAEEMNLFVVSVSQPQWDSLQSKNQQIIIAIINHDVCLKQIVHMRYLFPWPLVLGGSVWWSYVEVSPFMDIAVPSLTCILSVITLFLLIIPSRQILLWPFSIHFIVTKIAFNLELWFWWWICSHLQKIFNYVWSQSQR